MLKFSTSIKPKQIIILNIKHNVIPKNERITGRKIIP